MIERQIVAQQFYGPVFREDGYIPPAPQDALDEYGRLKREWQKEDAEGAIDRVVQLYPAMIDPEFVVYTVVASLRQSA